MVKPWRTLRRLVAASLLAAVLACQPLVSQPTGGPANQQVVTQPAVAPIAKQPTAIVKTGKATGNKLDLLPGIPASERPPVREVPVIEKITLGPIKADAVKVNQVGYLPAYRKIALVSAKAATSFQVVDTKTGKSVFGAELGPSQRDEEATEDVRVADFSKVTTPGAYTVLVPDVGRSPEFRIGDDVYQRLFANSLDSYDVLAQLAPKAWQTATAKDRDTAKDLDVTGGWQDAGDYGRYMPTAAATMGTLLLLPDLFPARADAKLDLAGLRQDVPGYLQIVKRELDWMLKMQRADGAVYHKVTPMGFGGFDKGSDNIGGELFAFEPSTPDAAVFAAVMAQAARVYRSVDGTYAVNLLAAAERSWRYLEQNPKGVLPNELEGTGGYVYAGDETQRFWAAAELFKTTGKGAYGEYVRKHLGENTITIEPLSWINPTTYGLIAYYSSDRADVGLKQQIGDALKTWADGMVTTIESPVNPYRVSLAVYGWSSNKTTLDNAVLLLVANSIAPNGKYVESALDQLHYVLGRNVMHKSYITGYGYDPVRNPHNRTMFAAGKIVPGVMVGGANQDAQDGIAPTADGPRSYVDDLRAYSVNENSIEYNAPLVFVTAFFRTE